jgi:hypothetical protein
MGLLTTASVTIDGNKFKADWTSRATHHELALGAPK